MASSKCRSEYAKLFKYKAVSSLVRLVVVKIWFESCTNNVFDTIVGDRAGSVKRKTPEATPNELKEKNKLIEAEKAETGSVSCILRITGLFILYVL